MKFHSKIGKLLTLVAATSAGFAIAFPGKTLANLDNLNSPVGNLSQGAPADAPPAPPSDTPPSTETTPADAPPAPPSDTSPAETAPPTDTPPSTETAPTETTPTETAPAPRSSAPEKGSWACLNNPNPACR